MKFLFNKALLVAATSSIFFLTGCGSQVEVPTAHVGKISTKNGLQEGIITPSKMRLSNICFTCNSLIIAEASDKGIKESMEIYMPKDQLNLKVDLRSTVTISSKEENINKLYARVTPQPYGENDRVKIIPLMTVYKIYAQPIIREATRSYFASKTINEVMTDRRKASEELTQIIREDLKSTPINVITLGLADIQPPAVITKARETAKEREIAIQQAEAEKQVKLKEAEANLEVAKKQQEVELLQAETQLLVENKLSEGVSDKYVTQRWLSAWDKLAANPEGKVIILPAEAMKNPSIMMGTNN